MKKTLGKNILIGFAFLSISIMPTALLASQMHQNKANDKNYPSQVVQKLSERAKQNQYWKLAFITGKNAQVVFMNITPQTNPKNEIGMEKHPFDQIIIVVEGDAKAEIAGKQQMVTTGDMIFIPQGTLHNFINLNKDKPFKIISIYSDRDIPLGSKFKTKQQELKKGAH